MDTIESERPRRHHSTQVAPPGPRESRETSTDTLVCNHLRLARRLARRYTGRGIPTDDLDQVAALGLVKAARRYDDLRGGTFAVFAVPTVTGEVRRHFRDQGWMVRPTRKLQELQLRLASAESDLTQELGRPPTHQELADRAGTTRRDVRGARAVLGCFTPQSIDAERRDDQFALANVLGAEDPEIARLELSLTISAALETLDHDDRELIRLRFVDELSQSEIGARIGATQSQVSRRLNRILESLRGQLIDH